MVFKTALDYKYLLRPVLVPKNYPHPYQFFFTENKTAKNVTFLNLSINIQIKF